MKKKKLFALYQIGHKPILQELSDDGSGTVFLNDESCISVERLTDLFDRVLAVTAEIDATEIVTTADFYFEDEWESLSNSTRRLLGMGLVSLVRRGLVPLTCLNPSRSGTKKYRLKTL